MVMFAIGKPTEEEEPVINLYLKKDSGGAIDVIAQCGDDWNYLMTFARDGTFHRHGGVDLPGIIMDECGFIKEV